MPITAIAVFAPGDTITSAWANILRDDINLLDSRTGGDPGGVDKALVSGAGLAAAWGLLPSAALAAGAALANLGYTPINKAGDTGIANALAWNTDVEKKLDFFGGSDLYTIGISGGAIDIRTFQYVNIVNSVGTLIFSFDVTTNELYMGSARNFKFWNENNDGPASGLAAQTAATATSATNALALGSIAAASYGPRVRSAFTGDGVILGRQITTGFAVKHLMLYTASGGGAAVLYNSLATTDAFRIPGDSATLPSISTQVHLHATDGFVVGDGGSGGNANTVVYTYVAYG